MQRKFSCVSCCCGESLIFKHPHRKSFLLSFRHNESTRRLQEIEKRFNIRVLSVHYVHLFFITLGIGHWENCLVVTQENHCSEFRMYKCPIFSDPLPKQPGVIE